jgi:NitT/TauT family transport system substrate-binding protein
LLAAAGIDPQGDVAIGPVPGIAGEKASFGLMAAKALEEGSIDGFWANGMGAEVAVRSGVGSLVLDVRRDGPEEAKGYTFPGLVTTQRLIEERPQAAAAARRAVVAAQQALKADPERAAEIGRKLFPPTEASLITELIRRDLPFYEASLERDSIDAMNRFARDIGLLSKAADYEEVVARL